MPPDSELQKAMLATAHDSEAEARFGLTWLADARPQIKSSYLIKGLLMPGGMSVLYGDSNTGKTFFALDLAAHIAGAQQWRGRRVLPGGVLYIAAEGGRAIQNRLVVLRDHLDIGQAPLALIPTRVDLLDPKADTGPLVDLIATFEGSPRAVRLIIIDTLSRAMAGGDENGSVDMTAFINNVDTIRRKTDAHVLIVHHCGKTKANGARGHSSLRAATDTEIEIAEKVATVTKQRDLPSGDSFAFDLRRVEIGEDEDGDAVWSCVVDHVETSASAVKLTGVKGAVRDLLARLIDEMGERPNLILDRLRAGQKAVRLPSLIAAYQTEEISETDNPDNMRRACRRAVKELREARIAGHFDDWVWLTDKAYKAGQ